MAEFALTVSPAAGFDDAVARTRATSAAEGFSLLTAIDIAATMRNKLDVDLPPFLMLVHPARRRWMEPWLRRR